MILGRLGSNQIDKATQLDNLNRFPTRADFFLSQIPEDLWNTLNPLFPGAKRSEREADHLDPLCRD
jgi:hypothetical protein